MPSGGSRRPISWTGAARRAAFESLAAFDDFSPTLSSLGEPERVHALSASGTFFTTLGATSAMGRTLLPEDDRADATDVAVLSDGFWRRAFGGSREAIGRTLILDGRPYTVVGIMPEGFDTPLHARHRSVAQRRSRRAAHLPVRRRPRRPCATRT